MTQLKWRDPPSLPPRIRAIVEAVSQESGVSMGLLFSESRTRDAAHARWSAWRKMRDLDNPPSFPLIGYWFNRDHSTVIHGVYK